MNLSPKLISALIPALGIFGLALFPEPTSPKKTPDATTEFKQVTYAEHVAPILNNNCVKCHRTGENAPFSLEGYANAKRYSDMIALATSKKRMPPWKVLPGDVDFRDDAHLSDEAIATLATWAEAGAPRGDSSKEPATPKFQSGWANGTPDMIWEMPYEHTLSAEGDDEYWNFVYSPKITEPTWISGIDVQPGNKNIVHHVIVFLDEKGQGKKLAQGSRGDGKLGYRSSGGGVGFNPDGALGGWAPGAHGHLLPSDAGFLLKPGTDVIIQLHYNKSGKPEKDKTQIAVYTNKSKPQHSVELAFIPNPLIAIKPGLANQKFTQNLPLPAQVGGKKVNFRFYNLMPHMHLLGKEMKATAVLPNGSEKTLIDLKDWDFNWQLIYTPVKPIDLPGGTKIRIEAVYDNSTDNPFQPNDPPKWVRWGEETDDEMMLLVAAFTMIQE
jgi:cytochrome c553